MRLSIVKIAAYFHFHHWRVETRAIFGQYFVFFNVKILVFLSKFVQILVLMSKFGFLVFRVKIVQF